MYLFSQILKLKISKPILLIQKQRPGDAKGNTNAVRIEEISLYLTNRSTPESSVVSAVQAFWLYGI